MSAYGWAWLVVVVAVPLGLFALHRATRGLVGPLTQQVLAVLVTVWLLLPAPVPGFEDHYAPAFLVLTLEGLFQQSGNPRTAGLILVAGSILAVALLLLVAVITRGRGKPASEASPRRRSLVRGK
jgi:hypothetical protein